MPSFIQSKLRFDDFAVSGPKYKVVNKKDVVPPLKT